MALLLSGARAACQNAANDTECHPDHEMLLKSTQTPFGHGAITPFAVMRSLPLAIIQYLVPCSGTFISPRP